MLGGGLFIVAILFSSKVKIKHYSSDEVRQAEVVGLSSRKWAASKLMNALLSQANTTAVSQWGVTRVRVTHSYLQHIYR